MTTHPQPAPLRAGAAQVEITPPMSTQIAGDIGRRRPAELLVDPLYAKALVLEAGERKVCILSLDLAGMAGGYAQQVREGIGGSCGIDPRAVMVHSTQSHAAPALGHSAVTAATPHIPPELSWLRGSDDRYMALALEPIVEAARRADAALEPACVGAASGLEGRVAFNRRFVMRDGTVRTHPRTGDPNIRYAEGPIDPELGMVAINTASLRMLALLLHYTCHPVHGYPERWISAGWPGAWANGMKELCGPSCVRLVFNGCCGNIHHANHLDPSYVDDFRRMGRLLTETSQPILKSLRYSQDIVLDWRSEHIHIPLREFSAKDVDAARDLLAKNPEPMWLDEAHTAVDWSWVYAVSFLDLYERRQREPEYDCEIQVFRLGDIALVGLPGEPFVEGQLRIKLESPAYPTYVAHHCNDALGYVPTPRAFVGGGYETRTSNWSCLAPEALDLMADRAITMLKDLF
jgi:neutral ceramidase